MLIKKSKIPVKELVLFGFFPSFLKKIIYRIKGYKIGKKVSIGIGAVIIGKDVEIGDQSSIGFFTVIRGDVIKIGRFVKIGSMSFIDTTRIEIDDDARINEQVYVGGLKTPRSLFKLGKRTIVMQMSYINPVEPVIIGDDTGIGGHCLLFTHGSWSSQLEGFPVTFAPITLGENVWLPWRVFIMPGVNVGDNVVIGANSLVSKDLPSNSLAAGSPAKILKENYPPKLDEDKRCAIIKNLFEEFIAYIKYYNFDTKKVEKGEGFVLNIKKSKKVNYIYFPENSKISDLKMIRKNSILILDNNEDISEIYMENKVNMIISFKSKKRIGTSDIGEEFVKFISRFGVRFDRID